MNTVNVLFKVNSHTLSKPPVMRVSLSPEYARGGARLAFWYARRLAGTLELTSGDCGPVSAGVTTADCRYCSWRSCARQPHRKGKHSGASQADRAMAWDRQGRREHQNITVQLLPFTGQESVNEKTVRDQPRSIDLPRLKGLTQLSIRFELR